MKGFMTIADVTAKYPQLTESVLLRAINYGLIPNARRKGEHKYYLPLDDIKALIEFRKLSRGEQIRQFHKDDGLMTTEEVSTLIDIGIGYFAKYRKRGLLPQYRFESFYQIKVYHIDDVMACVEKNHMIYDEKLAKRLGWPREEKDEKSDAKNAKNTPGEFKPMLQK